MVHPMFSSKTKSKRLIIYPFTLKKFNYFFLSSSNHPLINPRVNPADILPVKGILKLDIANEEAVVAAWPSALIPGMCISTSESVVIASSETV